MKHFNRTSRLLLLLVVDDDDVVHLPTGNTSHLDGITSHQQHDTEFTVHYFRDARTGFSEFIMN